MATVEHYRSSHSPREISLAVGLVFLSLLTGFLIGRGCDHRDWSLSTQWTKVTQVEDVTTGQRTVIQEQSGSTESRTQPGPNNPGANLFGTPDDVPAK